MQFAHENNVRTYEGRTDARVVFVSGVPWWDGAPISDAGRNLIVNFARKAGLRDEELAFASVLDVVPPGRRPEQFGEAWMESQRIAARGRLSTLHNATVLVPIGDLALSTLTEHRSSEKWQLSIIEATGVGRKKCVPLLATERIFADSTQLPFYIFGLQRIAEESRSATIKRPVRVFHTAPTFEDARSFLINKCLFADHLSVDIETAYGQITCVGFAPTPTEAMSVPLLPTNWSVEQFYALWSDVRDVLTGPSLKVFQNAMYDVTYFSKYGLPVRNLWRDTMLAQKFLHPELPMGLDTIARIYTREPYWKDEGKDWKAVEDLNRFWLYNCKDAAVTLEAAFAQNADLDRRGLTESFERLVMSLFPAASEMCWRGLPVSAPLREQMTVAVEADRTVLERDLESAVGRPINSRSPKQVKDYLRAKKYRVPTKRGKETSDVTALLKLQQRYPGDRALTHLIALSEKNKLIGSYLKPKPYPDGRFRFSLNLHGAETGRWSCRKDPWDNGLNVQTISSDLKKMFEAPPGWVWLECDLKQADSRFVAWDANEPTLIKFYTEGTDIHRYVAGRPELFNKPLDVVTKDERQLGKKVGHASNYGMRGARLSEICLLEMGLPLDAARADRMIDGYHRVFPGLRLWQARIASEIRRFKRLTTPLGRERYFYGRLGDDLYRVAYAYRPQSTVADVVNCLLRHLDVERNPEMMHFALQAHDAAIALVHESYLDEALTLVKAENAWNPTLPLSGGPLRIPIEIKVGPIWGTAKVVHG